MKSKIFKTLNNKKLFILSGLTLLVVSAITQGALSGLDIADTMENGLALAQTIGFFIVAIGVVTFIINMFLGSRSMPVAAIGVGCMVGGWVIANIEKVITWLTKLTAGACF